MYLDSGPDVFCKHFEPYWFGPVPLGVAYVIAMETELKQTVMSVDKGVDR
jgi:hypothetical protein